MLRITFFCLLLCLVYVTSENLLCREATNSDAEEHRGWTKQGPSGKRGERGKQGDRGDANGQLNATESKITELEGFLDEFSRRFSASQSANFCGKNSQIVETQCIYLYFRQHPPDPAAFCESLGYSLPLFTSKKFADTIVQNISQFFFENNQNGNASLQVLVKSRTLYNANLYPSKSVFQPDGTNVTLTGWLPNYPVENGTEVGFLMDLQPDQREFIKAGFINGPLQGDNITEDAVVCTKNIPGLSDN